MRNLSLAFLLVFILLLNCSSHKQSIKKTSFEMEFINQIFYDFIENCVCEESWNIPIYIKSTFIVFEDDIADEIRKNAEFYLKQIKDTSFREAIFNLTDSITFRKNIEIEQITNRGTFRIYDDRLYKKQGILLSLSCPAFNLTKTKACLFYNVSSNLNVQKYGIAFFSKINERWYYYKKWIITN